jgi:hypothetical protein
LTIFDLVIVVLTWREYRQQRRAKDHAVVLAPGDAQAPPQAAVRSE